MLLDSPGQKDKEERSFEKHFFKKAAFWQRLIFYDLYSKNHLTISDADTQSKNWIIRLIFLRLCEEHNLEPKGQLEKLSKINFAQYSGPESPANTAGQKIAALLQRTKKRYKSPLFSLPSAHIIAAGVFAEVSAELCGLLCSLGSNLDLNDKKIPETFAETILGKVYEYFQDKKLTVVSVTGKTKITLSTSDNPRKKSRGVYYTPQPIIKKIVHDTVGELLQKKPATGDDQDTSLNDFGLLRILDPSCGCGSFLLYAYDYLIKYHQQKRQTRGMSVAALSLRERQKILTGNIFGVDIDPVAVMITKLNLILKLFSTAEKSVYDQACPEDKNIPDLDINIQCGNSLVEPDIRDFISKNNDGQRVFVGMNEIFNKSFNWSERFPFLFCENTKQSIKEKDGFDVIIGNPPYISYYSRHSVKEDFRDQVLSYLAQKYEHSNLPGAGGRFNTIMFFLENSVRLLKEDGYCGYIVDMNVHEKTFDTLRTWMLKKVAFKKIYNNLKGFNGVKSGQTVLVFQKKLEEDNLVEVYDGKNLCSGLYPQQQLLNDNTWKPMAHNSILKKMDCDYFNGDGRLGDWFTVSTGVNIGGVNERFLFTERANEKYYPYITTNGFYSGYETLQHGTNYICYDHNVVYEINREAKKKGSKNIITLGNLERFIRPRLLVRQTASTIIATYSEKTEVTPYSIFVINVKTESCGFKEKIALLIGKKQEKNSTPDFTAGEASMLKFLLGLLNSKAVRYYAAERGIVRKGYGKIPQIRKSGLSSLPICGYKAVVEQAIFSVENGGKALFLDMISNVERLLFLKKQPLSADDSLSAIAKTQQEIDSIAYALYGLMPKEVATVEDYFLKNN